MKLSERAREKAVEEVQFQCRCYFHYRKIKNTKLFNLKQISLSIKFSVFDGRLLVISFRLTGNLLLFFVAAARI